MASDPIRRVNDLDQMSSRSNMNAGGIGNLSAIEEETSRKGLSANPASAPEML
jgi:hypothetical protein